MIKVIKNADFNDINLKIMFFQRVVGMGGQVLSIILNQWKLLQELLFAFWDVCGRLWCSEIGISYGLNSTQVENMKKDLPT